MKVVAIVQARGGSTRFPNKVMADVLGEPLILRELERIRRARTIDEIVVATTDDPLDDALAAVVADAGHAVFRGSEDDVLSRYAGAAAQAGADVVVRLTGDCPLVDPALIDETVQAWLDGRPEVDFASNALSETYPDGMDTEVFSAELLARAAAEARLPSEREHVTFWFWKTGRFAVRSLESPRPLGGLRLTVDYPEDLELVRAVYERLYRDDPDFGLDAIVAVVEDLGELPNSEFERNAGWRTAERKDAEFRQ